MKFRRSLFMRILFWFFINLVVIVVVLLGVFNLRLRPDPHSMLRGLFGGGMFPTSLLIRRELTDRPRNEWKAILKRFADVYDVEFRLISPDGRDLSGGRSPVPDPVMKKIEELGRRVPNLPEMRIPGAMAGREVPPPRPPRPPGVQGKAAFRGPPESASFMTRTTSPVRYWYGILIPIKPISGRVPVPAVLLAASDSMTGNGLFFDPTPWVILLVVVVTLSVLLWLPLVRGLTRPITRMTGATRQIAKGRFDIRLPDRRHDEIGELARSINHMAERLDAQVKGQKRFLGDVAHELASPIARLQLGLGILENRVGSGEAESLRDVQEEVEHMSNLVNELLSFTRAEVDSAKVALDTVLLKPIVDRVIQRESDGRADIRVDVSDEIKVYADVHLLSRALANLVRNALRYAGSAGPIGITADLSHDRVQVEVWDSGSGVPEDALPRLFEPFFRPESSRERSTGGVGLGLSIVRTCVETCGGTVSCRNLSPSGFSVTMEFLSRKPSQSGNR
jgi:two-component system sensor histidine kinase CpxA